jgi:hypothetical protein
MELSASRTMHAEREIQRVQNDHFGGDASRHRHAEYRTPDHNVRHKWSLPWRRELEEMLCVAAVTGSDMREAVIIAIACFFILIMVAVFLFIWFSEPESGNLLSSGPTDDDAALSHLCSTKERRPSHRA